jgi:hypothetical protein
MNDGQTWTKVFVIPAPPGAAGTGGCPCDQTYDCGRNNVLFGSILTEIPATGFGNIYTGPTTNPKNAASWKWFTTFGNAQLTNEAADALDMSDQPWMLHNRGTLHANSQNVFAAYDDFSTNPRGMRVARSINNVPPQFAAGSDPIVGTSAAGTNPGHRSLLIRVTAGSTVCSRIAPPVQGIQRRSNICSTGPRIRVAPGP